jgi:hypothetical protein
LNSLNEVEAELMRQHHKRSFNGVQGVRQATLKPSPQGPELPAQQD